MSRSFGRRLTLPEQGFKGKCTHRCCPWRCCCWLHYAHHEGATFTQVTQRVDAQSGQGAVLETRASEAFRSRLPGQPPAHACCTQAESEKTRTARAGSAFNGKRAASEQPLYFEALEPHLSSTIRSAPRSTATSAAGTTDRERARQERQRTHDAAATIPCPPKLGTQLLKTRNWLVEGHLLTTFGSKKQFKKLETENVTHHTKLQRVVNHLLRDGEAWKLEPEICVLSPIHDCRQNERSLLEPATARAKK